MRELLSISQHGDFRKRIFPVFFAGTPIFKITDRAQLSVAWLEKFNGLHAAVSKGAILAKEDMAEYNRILAFYTEVGSITRTITDMSLFNVTKLDEASFQVLRQKLTERLHRPAD